LALEKKQTQNEVKANNTSADDVDDEELKAIQDCEWWRAVVAGVGDGRTGKTSFFMALRGEPVEECQSTTGIDIHQLRTSNVTTGGEGGDEWTDIENEKNLCESEIAKAIVNRKKKEGKQSQKDSLGVSVSSDPEKGTTVDTVSVVEKAFPLDKSKKTTGNKTIKVFQTNEVKGFDKKAIKKMMDELRTDSELIITLQDYGGQPVFYTVHHFFIKENTLYAIVFNMEDMLDEEKMKTAIQTLLFWINSIVIHTLNAESNTCAPVVFVGTHKDKCPDPSDHDKISKIINTLVASSPIKNDMLLNEYGLGSKGTTLHYFYPVDNLKGKKDPVIVRLMKQIHKKLCNTDFVRQKKPLTWLKFIDLLKAKNDSYISYEEALEIANNIGVPTVDFEDLLKFLHETSHLMWFQDSSVLRKTVILDPFKFLLNAITTVIRKHRLTDDDPTIHVNDTTRECERRYPDDWMKLMEEGIVSHQLLYHLIGSVQSDNIETIVHVMFKFNLMVQLVSSEDEDERDENSYQYLLPSLLHLSDSQFVPYQTLDNKKNHCSSCMFLFSTRQFDTKDVIPVAKMKSRAILPSGLFTRLLGKVVGHCQQFDPLSSMQLYQNEITARLGNQRFRLKECLDEPYILLEVEGTYALSVYQIIQEFIQGALQECMNALKFTAVLPVFTNDGYDATATNGLSVDCYIPIDLITDKISKKQRLNYLSNKSLSTEEMKSMFFPYLELTGIKMYDVFVSYRWSEFDSNFVVGLYNGSTRRVVGESNRQIAIFVDHKRLKKGENFQQQFAEALINSTMIVPIISAEALARMKNHNPHTEDNVMIEWMLVSECLKSKQSRAEKALPVFYGTVDIGGKIGKIFDHINELPKDVIPTASIAVVKSCLTKMGMTASDSIDSWSVFTVVNSMMKNLGIDLSEKKSNNYIRDVCNEVYETLVDCKGIHSFIPPASSALLGNIGGLVEQRRSEIEANRTAEQAKSVDSNYDDKLLENLVEWLQKEVNVISSDASIYASAFVAKKLTTIERLAKYIKGHKNCLEETFNVDEVDADEIIQVLKQKGLLE
jgi:GTPase SAR1 family protein